MAQRLLLVFYLSFVTKAFQKVPEMLSRNQTRDETTDISDKSV